MNVIRHHRYRRLRVLLAAFLASQTAFAAPEKSATDETRPIEQFLAHPLFDTVYMCSEHAAGELPYLGDDLGQDCVPHRFIQEDGRGFLRAFKGDGAANEDWYGWKQVVLSPCDCTVEKIIENPVTNLPGKPGKPPASVVMLRTSDGVFVSVAHLQEINVKIGDALTAGRPIGRVGNNGFARTPHIHIGAWKDKTALQIRWDQRKVPLL